MPVDSAAVRKRIEAIDGIPTLPTVANQILAIANNPKTSATDVGELISRDQAMTSKVLRLVNSSFYGFPKQITTINHAIVILGFNKVKNVVLTASVFDLGGGGHALDIKKFWVHSLGSALAAQVVAQRIGGSLAPEDAFVGGLIHDIGKMIMDQCLRNEYSEVAAMVREKHMLLREAEREVFGFDHQMVGSWVAEKWKLPGELAAAIRFHHLPGQEKAQREMAAAVHLGDILCRSLGVGSGGDGGMPVIDKGVAEIYRVDNAFLNTALEKLVIELRRAGEFFCLINK